MSEFFAKLEPDPSKLLFKQCRDDFGEIDMDLIENLTKSVKLTDDTVIKGETTWKTFKEFAMHADYEKPMDEQSEEFKTKYTDKLKERISFKSEEKRIISKLIRAQKT